MTSVESRPHVPAVALAAAARALGEPGGVPAMLERVVRVAVTTVPACEDAQVTLTHDSDTPFISMATFDHDGSGGGTPLEVPLVIASADGDTEGVLTFHSGDDRPFDGDQRQLAEAYGAVASLAIGAALAQLRAGLHEEQLREAIESRDIIGQAKGILMARESCNADQAFEILRRASQRENLKLRDIATRVASHFGLQGHAPS